MKWLKGHAENQQHSACSQSLFIKSVSAENKSCHPAAPVFIIRSTDIGFSTYEVYKGWLNLLLGSASSNTVCSPSLRSSWGLSHDCRGMQCYHKSVALSYGPSELGDCCLCCRPVGTSRTTECARTPARASCATTPTCTSWYPTHWESTTSGPPASGAAHVRMDERKGFFLTYIFLQTCNTIQLITSVGRHIVPCITFAFDLSHIVWDLWTLLSEDLKLCHSSQKEICLFRWCRSVLCRRQRWFMKTKGTTKGKKENE